MKNYLHPFESILSVTVENIENNINFVGFIEWSEFILNPRRLRGSDFLMRWSQGVWSEHRLTQSINEQTGFYSIPYGPSSTAPHSVKEFELYFERLEKAGLGSIKRPDLLIFKKSDKEVVDKLIEKLGGEKELPFCEERFMKELIDLSVIGVECENSLWVARKMPDYNTPLTPQKRLGGKIGLKKAAVLPTVIIKEEDRKTLSEWQEINNKPLHIWHVFFDYAYGIALDEAERLIKKGIIERTIQIFQAPGGATTKKPLYKIYYRYAYQLGKATEEPKLNPTFVEDKNGHILPYVTFSGGNLEISKEAIEILSQNAINNEK